ncbi:MAG: hypothetical protein D6702_03865 [Planctomycetota bacterium]|nr:MAG: hypothetical protein D6702_03865 [Planctomycetota bacterium]
MAAAPPSAEPWFREQRRVSRRLASVLWGAAGGVFLAGIPFGVWSGPGLPAAAAILGGLAWWLRVCRLTTEVGPDGLCLRLAPFPARRFAREELRGWHVHLAWPWEGARPRPRSGVTVWHGAAGPGLTVELEGGRTFWLGSSRPLEFEAALLRLRRRRS